MKQRFKFAASAIAFACGATAQAACPTTIGVVVPMTGPAGQYGQTAAKAIQMAFRDLNQAGGVIGCPLDTEIRDDQSQGAVGVDAARQLVDIRHVPAIIGSIISSVTLPVLTSVTVPAGVVQISPASTTPTLTTMAREGKTRGLFFRTITSDALQSLATGQFAADLKLKKVAVIYVNNDYGVNLNKEFARAFTALGGTIVSATPYNERQASYQPEVTKALASKPEALYLIGYPTDGATIVRTWISLGGAQKFLLNDGLNSDEFIKAVGPRYLAQAYGTSSGTPPSASTRYFAAAYPAFSNFSANAPGADRAYDAAALIGLAIAWAGKADSASIRDGIRRVLDPQGAMIGAGPDEFKRGLALIEERKPIRYNGLIGPVQFDKHGDITGPFIKWQIVDGKVKNLGEVPVGQIDSLKARTGE
ncbi:amino acid ABC transporter substrate-binding protein [Verminephrobacter eiseniae]|uniref:ABC transporter substrate-binding protein n=1 Tax=Verminephrobacter eiseniae TaxID=364317 RepID=UPI0022379B3E|nr:ABC transporter substrate-binding protein [Verminephrobacter eiseniae]MCW5262896.1 amino acid ABC transporter substrate-binding protein [Verminephrobacter eiseniae]